MTQSLQIVFKDGTRHWGPIFFKNQKIENSTQLLEVLLDNPHGSLINLNGSSWSYPLSQIDKFKDYKI